MGIALWNISVNNFFLKQNGLFMLLINYLILLQRIILLHFESLAGLLSNTSSKYLVKRNVLHNYLEYIRYQTIHMWDYMWNYSNLLMILHYTEWVLSMEPLSYLGRSRDYFWPVKIKKMLGILIRTFKAFNRYLTGNRWQIREDVLISLCVF